MNNKKNLSFTVLFLLFYQIMCCQNKTVRVGIYQNPPKIYWDKNGKPKGLWVDIIKIITANKPLGVIYG